MTQKNRRFGAVCDTHLKPHNKEKDMVKTFENGKSKMKAVSLLFLSLLLVMSPEIALATTLGNGGTSGTEFQAFYNFIYGAATGYLGRAIAIVGGLAGLAWGATSGKASIAALGILLAVFGVLGPTIVDSLFTSAII